MPIRLAALEAARGLSCTAPRFVPAMAALFRDPSFDAELRIAAYLGIMHCPTETTAASVKQLLAREDVNQGKLCSLLKCRYSSHPLSFFSGVICLDPPDQPTGITKSCKSGP